MEAKKKIIQFIALSLLLVIVTTSCEERFEPDYADDEPTIVIEGYIQAGEDAIPPYVIISKTYSLFQNDQIQGPELYLGGGIVRIKVDGEEHELEEVCTDNLPDEAKSLLTEVFGIDSLIIELGICFYIDLDNTIQGEVGKQYDLEVEFEGELLTATTTIPEFIGIDSFNIYQQGVVEGFRALNGYFTDPIGPNFYRLKTNTNGGRYANDFSVTDDIFFDGQTFEFPINNQADEESEIDPNTFGLYMIGDTVGVEWQLIDAEHYEFWNTLEFSRGNQGPFASYTRAASNITGGIGIWGGSSIEYYEIIIE